MVILVVEDEAILAMALEAVLTDAGHVVLGPASTASRAVEIAERQQPDLALVDINLRDGSSGVELARAMQARWGTPSLFMTAQGQQARANQDAALGLLGKPYDLDTVLASVEIAKEVIDGRNPPPPPVPRGLELFAQTRH